MALFSRFWWEARRNPKALARTVGAVALLATLWGLAVPAAHAGSSARPADGTCAIADLGTLPDGYASQADGINDRGQIVGIAYIVRQGYDVEHAVWWDHSVIHDLGAHLGTYTFSVASAINNNGQAVGTLDLNHGLAVEWDTHTGMMTVLPVPHGGGAAYGINDGGQVVGSVTESSGQYAALWDKGVLTVLGALPGTMQSSANAINASGQVTGRTYVPIGSGTFDERALLWDAHTGTPTELPSAGLPSAAAGINGRGQVVGFVLGSAVE